MGGVRHSGASHPLIILPPFLRQSDRQTDLVGSPFPRPHDEEFLNVVSHPQRFRHPRPRTYTHLRLDITKEDKRTELIPIHDLPFLPVPNFPLTLGACTYDVCTGRGEGGTPKADAVRELSKGGCMKIQTRGEGVKNPENLADVLCTWPLLPSFPRKCQAVQVPILYNLSLAGAAPFSFSSPLPQSSSQCDRPTYISVRRGQPSSSRRGCANRRPRLPAQTRRRREFPRHALGMR